MLLLLFHYELRVFHLLHIPSLHNYNFILFLQILFCSVPTIATPIFHQKKKKSTWLIFTRITLPRTWRTCVGKGTSFYIDCWMWSLKHLSLFFLFVFSIHSIPDIIFVRSIIKAHNIYYFVRHGIFYFLCTHHHIKWNDIEWNSSSNLHGLILLAGVMHNVTSIDDFCDITLTHIMTACEKLSAKYFIFDVSLRRNVNYLQFDF